MSSRNTFIPTLFILGQKKMYSVDFTQAAEMFGLTLFKDLKTYLFHQHLTIDYSFLLEHKHLSQDSWEILFCMFLVRFNILIKIS